jgi:hypothetical protein
MKQIFCILLVVFSFNAFSQNLRCCKNIDEVKRSIQGDWKLKGANQNIIYRFRFDKDKGYVEVLEELNLPPKAEKSRTDVLFVDDETVVNVKLKKDVFFIELVYQFGSVSEAILELNEAAFIYGKESSKKIFIRDKN